VSLAGASVGSVEVTLTGRDIALRYPANFKSRVRADLTLKGKPGALLLAGEVHAERGLYDTDIFLGDQLLAPTLAETKPSPLFETIALDIQASTDNPVLVRNNLAELEASGHLELRGDLSAPAPFGRLEIREGGKVFLQGRDFTITSGNLIYGGTLDPDLAIRAETLIKQIDADDVQVTVAVDGPLLAPEMKLTSDPSYSEREIVSLITTGRRNVALDSTAWVAGQQASMLLAGRVTRNLAKGLMGSASTRSTSSPSWWRAKKTRRALHLRQAAHSELQARLLHGPERRRGELLRGASTASTSAVSSRPAC
jgi:autotransporter translocation and assembly factor TamB